MAASDHHFVFVGGLEWSGTSLVKAFFAGHPLASAMEVTGSPEEEGQYVQDVYEPALAHGGSGRWAFESEMHLDESSPLCTPDNAERLWRSWQPYFDVSKPLLVETSPPNMLKSRFLQGLFPSSSFIMVVRHPVAVTEATRQVSHATRRSLVAHWLRAHELLTEDLSHLDRALVVHYEDLVADVAGECRRIMDFLKLPSGPLSATIRASPNDRYYRSWERGRRLSLTGPRSVIRTYSQRVERFGYRLTRPYVAVVSWQGVWPGQLPSLSSQDEGRPALPESEETQVPALDSATRPLAPAAPEPARAVGAPEATELHSPTADSDRFAFRPALEVPGFPGLDWPSMLELQDATRRVLDAGVAAPRPRDLSNRAQSVRRAVEPETDVGDASDPPAELRAAARGGSAFAIGYVATAVLQFVFFTLLAHKLPQATAGAVLEAIAIFTIVSNVTELGADTGLMRSMPVFLRRRPQDMARLARVALIPALLTSTVAAVAVFIYAPQLVPIFVHHAHRSRSIAAGTTTDLRILACLIPAATATTVAVAGVRAWTAKVSVLINSVVIPLARPLLFGGFLLIGMTARLATLAWALPVGAGALIAVYSLVARIRSEPRYREAVRAHSNRRPIAREFWSFSVPRTFGAVFQILISYIDVLFVGGLLSSRDAAAYSIASRYIVYGTFALQAVSMAVAPQLSRLIDARHRDGLNSVYQSSACWAMVASWPVLIVLAVFAPLFMSIFGAGYGIAASALSVLALAMLVNTGTGSTGVLLLMSGRSGLMLAFLAAGLGANVGLNLWLIPAHGPFGGLVGASIAWMVTILIMAIGPTIAIWRINGVLPFSRGWVVAALASGACFGILGLATRLVFGVRVVSFAVFAVVSTAAYAAVLFKWRQDLNVDAFGSLFGRFVRRFRVGKAT